jgi:DNA-directed RNA polymerase specialized sigma24 family protein
MVDSHSISIWLEELKRGDPEAARHLWERYFPQLVFLARRKLAGTPRRMEDEEDVALSALDSFCKAADLGRFPHVSDRESLWRLLCRITHRKAVDLVRRSQKSMGDAHVRGESAWGREGQSVSCPAEAPVATAPDLAAMVGEEVQRLLNMLPDDDLRAIALAKMYGHTNDELANRMNCAVRTIERRLKHIRAVWREEQQRYC